MNQQDMIADLEARAKALGLPMYDVCERAGVHHTTFSRWKLTERNPVPNNALLKNLGAIGDALTAAELSASGRTDDVGAGDPCLPAPTFTERAA